MSESEGSSFNENEDDPGYTLAEMERFIFIIGGSEGDNCTYSMVCINTYDKL